MNGFRLEDSTPKRCVSECPNSKVHILKDNNNYCLNSCPFPLIEYIIDYKRYCKYPGNELFSFYNGFYMDTLTCSDYIIEELNQCVSLCPFPFIYLSGKVCQRNCSPLHPEAEDNKNVCRSNCLKDEYEIISTQECVDECPSTLYIIEIIDRGIRFFVDDCMSMSYPYSNKDDRHCVYQCEYPYSYLIEKYSLCVSSCPEIMSVVDNKCVIDISIFENKKLYESRDLIIENINDLLPISQMIKGEDFIAELYTTDTIPSQSETVSSIEMSKCENNIRRENNIPEDETLIIVKYDKVNSSALFNQVEYEVMNKEGKVLNLSICDTINISYPINMNNTINIDIVKAEEFINEGIDVFDSRDDIFNDICSFYSYRNDTDKNVVITEGRNKLYQNVTLCEKNCIYQGINYTSKRILCDCEAKVYVNPFSSENNDVQFYQKGFSKIFSINIQIAKCYKIFIMTNVYWKYNFGFWFSICILCFELILFVYYIIFKRGHFYTELYNTQQQSPPSILTSLHNTLLINYFLNTNTNDTLDTLDYTICLIKEDKINVIISKKELQ